ncbi:MAG TPA: hypothetical protein VMI75_14340 [Polyangiaceae bacterium]|nr:hypothetical protein [Polyangiaceae bacterium]
MAHEMFSVRDEEMTGFSPLALGASLVSGVASGYAWGRGADPERRVGVALGVGTAAFMLSFAFAKGSVASHFLNGAAAAVGSLAAEPLFREGRR